MTTQTDMREAVQAELEEGFANHAPGLSAAERKKVSPNQQWLFDTVDGLTSTTKDINDTLNDLKRMLGDMRDTLDKIKDRD
jgi:hypothetical protein